MGEPQPSSPLAREGANEGRGERGGGGVRRARAGRGQGALPSSGSRPPRRANTRMASGARGTQAAGPACDAAPAAHPGLQVARRRMRVTDRRFPRTGAEQRGRNLSPEARAVRAPGADRRVDLARSTAAEPTCPPWSAACAPGAQGAPIAAGETGCGPSREVARTRWLGPYCGPWESPDLSALDSRV